MSKLKYKKDGTISHQGENSSGRYPLKFNSVEELDAYIKEYYQWAEENKKHITVSGLAWWLKCSRQTLINYENAEENDWLKRCSEEERKGYVDTIKQAKRFIEMQYEDSLFNKQEVTGAIFTLKNNYSWKDKQEVVTNNSNDINISLDEEN